MGTAGPGRAAPPGATAAGAAAAGASAAGAEPDAAAAAPPPAEPSLGALTPQEAAGLVAAIRKCWVRPQDPVAKAMVIVVWVALNPDGTVDTIDARGVPPGAASQQAFAAAAQAVRACSPYRLPPAAYGSWKTIEMTFDPSSP